MLTTGATPFLRAAKAGDVAAMRLLLEKGADAKLATRAGINPGPTAGPDNDVDESGARQDEHPVRGRETDSRRAARGSASRRTAGEDAGGASVALAAMGRSA